MFSKKASFDSIEIIVKFIDDNDLGPTKSFYYDEKPKREYSELEKGRVDGALAILNDYINEKIPADKVKDLFREKLQIPEKLAEELDNSIKKTLSEQAEQNVDSGEKDENNGDEQKKNIFSTLIE